MNSKLLQLIRPNLMDHSSFLEGLAEMSVLSDQVSWIYLGESADLTFPVRDYPGYVAELLRREFEAPPGFVTDTVFWAKCEGQIVGRISVRHRLNEFLKKVGGHIGYIVRPSARGQGLASEMLRQVLLLEPARSMEKVLLTCDETNKASAKTIIKNGGQIENLEPRKDGGPAKLRFWVHNDLTPKRTGP